ncbi:MAG: response regulator [Cyclobacteriaceae bacterium]|nr:response regulator [Cyclobacteriaceae bacterium]
MKIDTLLIDDDAIVLYIHKVLLEESDLETEVFTFEDGESALEYIFNNDKDDDRGFLLLLDINMPCMDGWEFMERLKKSKAYDRIVVSLITSSIDKSDAEKSKKYDIVKSFFVKPLSMENVNEIVNPLLKY